MMLHEFSNHLVRETSPYLLQHAHNPVDWYPWGDAAFEKAREEDKLVIVSIGYSACHWCHVMERESFEDTEVAEIMNQFFVCIKVDREERPDVDAFYMHAVQLMTGHGGWPLNCFALPDGRPVYGGTYYPKKSWMEVLMALANLYREDKSKVLSYAEELGNAVKNSGALVKPDSEARYDLKFLTTRMRKWKESFDSQHGGPRKAPKFMMPDNYHYLLDYGIMQNDQDVTRHVHFTLEKMALGGIYDQVGGGFCRYSVDDKWKVPHFEKMLYDNAQLISLYSKAYLSENRPLYKEIVFQTIEFLRRELKDPSGGYYSALDADSEGEEGKFYVWKKEELEAIEELDFKFVETYYNLNQEGYWEHGNYILLRAETDEDFGLKNNLELQQVKSLRDKTNDILLWHRSKRIRPGLDDKTLTSWNAMLIRGYCDAWLAFGEETYLAEARSLYSFLETEVLDGVTLYHSWKKGERKITGLLEDYAHLISALISLYDCTWDEKYLKKASDLTEYVMKAFNDDQQVFFNINNGTDKLLIHNAPEIQDNVIPAGNSVMAHNLHTLGLLMDNSLFSQRSELMLHTLSENLGGYGPAFSNWLRLYLKQLAIQKEVVITGPDAREWHSSLRKTYFPNVQFAGSMDKSDLPLLQGRFIKDKTVAFVCENKACGLPIESLEELSGALV